MKLIYGDALMNTICELRDNAIKWLADCREQRSAMTAIRAEQAVLTFNECISQVKKSSEVDATPVVRCKNCEYWYPEEDDQHGCCRKHDFWTSDIWFCADGERR